MRRGALAALLIALSLLTACGGREERPAAGVLFDATGISPDTALLTVDRREVTAGLYYSALTAACDGIAAAYENAGAEVDWSEPLTAGTLVADYAREQALSTVVLYATVENQAEKYGCALAQEDLDGMDAEWQAKAAEYGGERAYLAALDAMALRREDARRLAADRRLYLQLYRLYATPGSALHPADGAVADFGAQRGYLTLSALLLTPEDASPEALALCRKRGTEILEKLKNGGDFAALAGRCGETARFSEAQTLCPGTGAFPAAVETAANALAENAFSGAVETEAGLYILQRKALDLAALSDAYFDFLLQTAADEAEIAYGEAWQLPAVEEFYAALTAARGAISVAKP